ncbi:hypothetical protein TNCV_71421 [Trichonephila clavipes]|nr:hypothetical protein TNCV_71421 [Trichonephila clavipes]
MPSPVQSNCDAHDTIANGQYGAVWSMGHTQQVCVFIVLLPSNVWQQFFGRSAFLRQQETDLPPAELWCACSFLLIYRTIYLSSASVVLLTRPPPCRLLYIPVVLNDFHSRETTLFFAEEREKPLFRSRRLLRHDAVYLLFFTHTPHPPDSVRCLVLTQRKSTNLRAGALEKNMFPVPRMGL